jgi:hypothetical protein
MSIIITEGSKSDISTIYAYLNTPELYPSGKQKLCESFSAFNNYYSIGSERDFITKLNQEFPNKFSHYHIGWNDAS